MLEDELRHMGVSLDEALSEEILNPVMKKLSFNEEDDLYAAIGYGGITAIRVANRLRDDVKSSKPDHRSAIEKVNDAAERREQQAKRNAKAKAVMEYIDFCEGLFADRVLYHSNSCEWRFDKGTPFRLGVKEGVPLVWFETPADLHYASAKDQGVIHGTTGVYNYKENDWQGEGGRVDWTRTGLAADVCYADLSRYTAETKFPKFKADSVSFVHTQYFSSPIPGRIEEVLNVPSEPQKYSYPRFRSTQRDFVMKDIMPGVDYSGSFMMNGSKFITASSKHPAKLIFNHDGRAQLAVTSIKFTITPEKLTAENAAVSIYVGEDDSISNTGINVRYVPSEGQVVLINDPQRNFYSPYIDTYHELERVGVLGAELFGPCGARHEPDAADDTYAVETRPGVLQRD